jgi:hypothetical protein
MKARLATLQLPASLALSVGAAVVLVKAAIYLDYQETLALALPVLPSLFPIVYKVLAKEPAIAAGAERGPHGPAVVWRRAAPRLSAMRALHRVAIAVALSLATKYGVEALFLYALYRRSGLAFHVLFGEGGDSLLLYFLRGDLLSATAAHVLPLLAVEMIAMTAVGALWIGFTCRGNPVLEGLVAGTLVALAATFTNLAILYAQIESLARTVATLLEGSPAVFPLAGVFVQAFLYGCCSKVAEQWRREPASHSARAPRASRPTRAQTTA